LANVSVGKNGQHCLGAVNAIRAGLAPFAKRSAQLIQLQRQLAMDKVIAATVVRVSAPVLAVHHISAQGAKTVP
jgi:hypothetical protein